MYAPILRSTLTLVALVVAYQAYVLTVAPLVEPPAVVRGGGTITDEDRLGSHQAIGRYQALLAAYFPPDHWSLATPPKVIRVDELMLVLSDYRRHDNGSIDLDKCLVLLIPKEWQLASPPPSETVVLEAPGGAHLQFDDEFQPARGKAGRIVRGEFPGEIVIRSDMKLPGPEDDLYIHASDLVMNETLIRTESEVIARLGPNRGSGRKMVIRLSRDEHIQRGPSINGLQSLEVYEDVELLLQPDKIDLFGGDADKVANVRRQPGSPTSLEREIRLAAAEEPRNANQPPHNEPPVRITCEGRFHFDLLGYVASFDQQVKVQRERLVGVYDQLDCNELSVRFAAVDEQGLPIDNADDPNVARKQRAAVANFQPIAIEATGNPVRAESAVERGAARAQRMRINLYARRITLDGGHEVMLAHAGSEIHAPFIEYQLPPQDSPRSVGELSMAGPGWLRTVPDETRPDRVVDIAWKQVDGVPFPVKTERRGGQPVLVLSGNPVVDAHRLGKVEADRLELMLREVPTDGPDGPALEVTDSSAKLAVIPERLLAAGHVAFSSPELTGRTHQLEASFEPWQPKDKVKTQLEAKPEAGTTQLTGRSEKEQPRSQYNLIASQIHLDLSLTGQRAEPTSATCEGSVLLQETRTARAGDEPLVVRGDRLHATNLHEQAKITITGRKAPGAGGSGGATIEARGLRLSAERIDADQAAGKFWINGPGQATMEIDSATFGQEAGAPTPVTLTWQQGLDAAGQRVVVTGRVLADSQHGWVQSNRAVAHLNRPLALAGAAEGGKIKVARVTLEGSVVVDHRGTDEEGQRSHENLQLESVAFDRLTGDIQGKGPGVLRSTRLADSTASFADLAAASRARPRAEGEGSATQLRFLRVDFAKGLSGNVNQRVVRFHERVRSVYGPVDAWQQELPLHDPDRLPPDTVTLACETLVVNEAPHAERTPDNRHKLGPIELQAIDNVEIEGRSEKHGVFQAQATTASYSQDLDRFVLDGDGTRDAALYSRDPQASTYGSVRAGKILYWLDTGWFRLEQINSPIDFQQTAPREAAAPAKSR